MSAAAATAEREAFVAALADATRRLASVHTDDLDTPVAACPGWTVRRLAMHVGRIHRWVAVALQSPAGRHVPAVARPAADVDLGVWLLEGVDHLLGTFEEAGPDAQVTSPGWERPAAWWLRRTAHETTIHAWDAEAAIGAPRPIPAALALDGIDEVMDVFIPLGLDRSTFLAGRSAPTASLHLHCTDVPDSLAAGGSGGDQTSGEWLVTVGPETVEVERRHAKGDAAVRAGASDLLLLLWNRVDHQRMEVHGDADLLRRYQASARY
jgi:uncharacterized protein (TIGR03083 family)